MKIAEVKIGETYLTTVSGVLAEVVVIQRIEPSRAREQTRFRVKRVDNGKVLTSRAASALRPVTAPDPVAQALLKQVDAARQLENEGKWDEAVIAWNALAKTAKAASRPKMTALAQHYAENALAKTTPDSEASK